MPALASCVHHDSLFDPGKKRKFDAHLKTPSFGRFWLDFPHFLVISSRLCIVREASKRNNRFEARVRQSGRTLLPLSQLDLSRRVLRIYRKANTLSVLLADSVPYGQKSELLRPTFEWHLFELFDMTVWNIFELFHRILDQFGHLTRVI
jgi:hypothetical protein